MTTTPSTSEPTELHAHSNESETSFAWLIILLAVVAASLLAMYFTNFNDAWGNQADFGAFGDFLGGVLNPVLGFATVGLLIWSLKLQMNELSLTRQELAETKEETALSRLAMQEQVAHLQKEAKLNELMRLMSDLRAQLQKQTLIKVTISDELFQICYREAYSDGDFQAVENLNIYNILYENSKWTSLISRHSHSLKNNFDDAALSKIFSQWHEFENLLIHFATLVLRYHELSSNPDIANIYIDEARKMLQPFHDLFLTEAIAVQLDLINGIIRLAR
ncbi:MAG: putative membrane protein [Oleiphilaceae bacterium]|jgi:uncharacterized membrane protein